MRSTVLHVGCGPVNDTKLHSAFRGSDWREIRLDLDPEVEPDIIASITDMRTVQDGSVHALYSSHNLEHLYPPEVPLALHEFNRVLSPNGFALIAVPDLQAVAELVAADKLDEVLYESPAGPVAPHDIIYGFRPSLAAGNLFMAHRTGFTARTLGMAAYSAGFPTVIVQRERPRRNLWALAFKFDPDDETRAEWEKRCFTF